MARYLLRRSGRRPGGSRAPLIDFVGLEWDPACLEFHANRRVVRTPSLVQVRQPIHTHRSAVGETTSRSFSPCSAPSSDMESTYRTRSIPVRRFESSISPPLSWPWDRRRVTMERFGQDDGEAGNEGDPAPRYTIGQIMLVIAVFAASLALPRLMNSPDRLVVGCLIGVLATLVLINKVIEVICGKPCPAARAGRCDGSPGIATITDAWSVGLSSSGSGRPLARCLRPRRRTPISQAVRGRGLEGICRAREARWFEQRPPAPEQDVRELVGEIHRLPAQPATGGGSRKPRRRFAVPRAPARRGSLKPGGAGGPPFPGASF